MQNIERPLPRVSIIIPVFNGVQWLPEALRSVYSQDMADIEIIVLDDGSSDGSWDAIQSVADNRCVCVRHPNRGLAATLNRGIAMARGEYVARLDQDDIMLPGRLAKQRTFLENHPEVAVVGTWAQIYEGEHPSRRFHRHPCSDEAIRLELLFDNPFVHASVMVRTSVLRALGGYSEDKLRQPPEDYELWSRIARQHQVANFPDVLTIYREFPNSMSRLGTDPLTARVMRIAAENMHNTLHNYEFDQCLALAQLYHRRSRLGSPSHVISKGLALRMLDDAATCIAGSSVSWSIEFRSSYLRLSKRLATASVIQRTPSFCVHIARRIKRIVTIMVKR